MKNLILKIIKKFGYTLKGNKLTIKHNNFYSIVKFLLKNKKNVRTYFDIGAGKGEETEILKKMDVKSQIHSFEPTRMLYRDLIEKYKNNKTIKINNIGIGKKKQKYPFIRLIKQTR